MPSSLSLDHLRIVFRNWLLEIDPKSTEEIFPTGVPTRAHFAAEDAVSNTVTVSGHCMDLRTTLVVVRKGGSEHACGDESCLGTITFKRHISTCCCPLFSLEAPQSNDIIPSWNWLINCDFQNKVCSLRNKSSSAVAQARHHRRRSDRHHAEGHAWDVCPSHPSQHKCPGILWIILIFLASLMSLTAEVRACLFYSGSTPCIKALLLAGRNERIWVELP